MRVKVNEVRPYFFQIILKNEDYNLELITTESRNPKSKNPPLSSE